MDLTMRRSISRSFAHVLDRAGHLLDATPDTLAELRSGLDAGINYPPAISGLLPDLLSALLNGQIDDGKRILSALQDLKPNALKGELVTLADADVTPFAALYTRLMNAEPGSRTPYVPTEEEQVALFREQFDAAMQLLRDAAPELGGEIDALVSQVIMVASDPASPYQFDGGSCYMLWGGLFINVAMPRSLVGLVEVIAHESAHIMLYAMAAEEALVENPDDELYPSPLRSDLRPMDGIYHATYVSARMHLAMQQLMASGQLDDSQTEQAREAMEADARNFYAGYAVVERHGRLTPTGRAVMASARHYMANAARQSSS